GRLIYLMKIVWLGYFRVKKNNIYFAEELEPLFYLEDIIKKSPDLERWAQKTLQPVLNYDQGKNFSLLVTLKILLLESENLHEAAAKLFIHKNTLMYRKQLIERLLGTNPFEKKSFFYSLAIYILLLSKPELFLPSHP
ncbi:MAG: helix-turn-helix domain-containing protein, partial [Moorella sp. (in: firmicutes)]